VEKERKVRVYKARKGRVYKAKGVMKESAEIVPRVFFTGFHTVTSFCYQLLTFKLGPVE